MILFAVGVLCGVAVTAAGVFQFAAVLRFNSE